MFEKAETKEIKKALQKHFSHAFSVCKDRGTASHWISVSWRDGATQEDVRAFCAKYNDGARDDIQTDLWCGSQYTSEHREHSLEAFLWAVKQIEREHNIKLKVTIQDSWRGNGEKTGYIKREDDIEINNAHPFSASQVINQLMYKTDFRKVKYSEAPKEKPVKTVAGNGKTIRENKEKNGVGVIFESKPSAEVLTTLKANGWRWSPSNQLWYNRLTPENIEFAKNL